MTSQASLLYESIILVVQESEASKDWREGMGNEVLSNPT